MANTLDALAEHLARTGASGKVVVWAHNSHIGDARATALGDAGELNLGQLTRERHGKEALLVGFTTHTGTVTAAHDWGEPVERKHVRPSMPNSVESLFHKTNLGRFLVRPGDVKGLEERHLERAIGVIYRPKTERASHYFHVSLAEQFDWVIHLDETRALEPLERTGQWEQGELPETYPSAL
jgi:erythromycin esterase-like protein